MFKSIKVAMVAAAVTFGAAATANAAVVNTSGNLATGQGAGGTSDPYWTITAAVGTAPSSSPTIQTYNTSIFPFNAYAAPIGTSQWITPDGERRSVVRSVYRTASTPTFRSLRPSSTIAGQFMSDNTVSDITLSPVGQHPTGGGGFTSADRVRLQQPDLGRSTVHAEPSRSRTSSRAVETRPRWTCMASAVPEPSTWAMMILGFLGLGFLGYRKSSKTSAASFRMV